MNQQTLPNATAVLILGILSIITCFCYGLPGIITGAIALFLYGKDKKLYDQNPTLYSNYGTLSAGRIIAIIGLILSVLTLVWMIFLIATVGIDGLQDQELMKERMEDLFGQ